MIKLWPRRSFRRRSSSSLSGEEKVNMLQVGRVGDLVRAKEKHWGEEHHLSREEKVVGLDMVGNKKQSQYLCLASIDISFSLSYWR